MSNSYYTYSNIKTVYKYSSNFLIFLYSAGGLASVTASSKWTVSYQVFYVGTTVVVWQVLLVGTTVVVCQVSYV